MSLAAMPERKCPIISLASTKGGKTRAILKLAGRAAFALTVAAMDLASWVFAALCAVFGFCATVKRTTERATERYLWWRKARRMRARAAMAASPAH